MTTILLKEKSDTPMVTCTWDRSIWAKSKVMALTLTRPETKSTRGSFPTI